MMKKLLLLAALLLACPRPSPRSEVTSVTYWHGWYAKGHKVGYLQTVIQTYPDHFRFESRGKLVNEMAGTRVTMMPNTVCNTDRNYVLRDFDFTMSTPGHDNHTLGAVRGTRIVMTSESGGQRQSATLELSGPVYPLEALPRLLRDRFWGAPGKMAGATRYEITVFDALVRDTTNAEIRVLGHERLTVRDTAREALKVSALLFKVPHMLWLDSSGVVLREESPPSSLALLEPSSEAMSFRAEETPPDLMSMFAVPANVRLENARALKYVRLELGGIEARSFDLADETQRVVGNVPLVLAIAPAGVPSSPVSLPIAGDPGSLGPTRSVQSDNALIVRKARELARGETDAVKVCRSINDWVFLNVRQKGTASLPSATDVLASLEGDCNEHAVLFAALCRAAGIPTKVCVGLVYRDGFFWYHAWNKVCLGTVWVPVDPTFGQFPADATHLKLKEGEMDQQAQVLNVVGNLTVNILEAR
jgi:hypothetical protein